MDINKIIEAFEQSEQKSFSIYKLLTEYCAENKVLRRDVQRIRQNLEDRKDRNEMEEEKRNNKLHALKEELEKRRMSVDEIRQKLEKHTQQVNEALQQVEEIFNMLGCSLEPFHYLLGDKHPSVHCLNLTFCLINEKIKELVQTAYYYERHVQKKSGTSRLKKFTVHPELPECWTAVPINELVPADPCPSCVEARWMSRVTDIAEVPLDENEVPAAIKDLNKDPAFVRSDHIHPLTECRVPRSRLILARRYNMQN